MFFNSVLFVIMMEDCPTCGDSFDTERGVKIHHSQAHDISLTEFNKDRKWAVNGNSTEGEESIDRMVKHLEDTIEIQKQRYDLDSGLA